MEWMEMNELKDVVEMLKKALPKKLPHIESDKILYAAFSKKRSTVKAKIGPIPPRFAIFLKQYDYFLEIHRESWATADEGTRLYFILHELNHIPADGFDRQSKVYKKTVKHDLMDFKDLVKEYGVDLENVEKLTKLVG